MVRKLNWMNVKLQLASVINIALKVVVKHQGDSLVHSVSQMWSNEFGISCVAGDIQQPVHMGRYVTNMKLEMHDPERIIVSSLAALVTCCFSDALVRH